MLKPKPLPRDPTYAQEGSLRAIDARASDLLVEVRRAMPGKQADAVAALINQAVREARIGLMSAP